MQALTFPPGSVERMVYIAAFAVSGYASTAGRTNKPFNPLLGETYELVYPEKVRRRPAGARGLGHASHAST